MREAIKRQTDSGCSLQAPTCRLCLSNTRSSTSSRSASSSPRRSRTVSTRRAKRRTKTTGLGRLHKRWTLMSTLTLSKRRRRRRLSVLTPANSDIASCSFSDEEDSGKKKKSSRKSKGQQAKARELQAQLTALLKKPLMMRGISSKYLTTRNRVGLVDQLVDGTGELPNARQASVQATTAGTDTGFNNRALEHHGRGAIDSSRRSAQAEKEEAAASREVVISQSFTIASLYTSSVIFVKQARTNRCNPFYL